MTGTVRLTKRAPHARHGGAVLPVAAAALLAITVAGCGPRIEARGHLPDSDDVLAIQPGIQTKDQVAELLGTPSTIGTFDDKTWYYIGMRTETTAFFEPEVLDQQVLVIRFDDGDFVTSVDVYGLEDAHAIDPVDEKTPTHGQRLTLLQQIFGNIGRFVKEEGETQ